MMYCTKVQKLKKFNLRSLEVLFPHWSWVSLEVMSCQTKFSSSVINELLMRYFLSKNTRPGGGCDEPWQKDVSVAGGFYLCGWKSRSQVQPAEVSPRPRGSLLWTFWGLVCLKAGAPLRKITGWGNRAVTQTASVPARSPGFTAATHTHLTD